MNAHISVLAVTMLVMVEWKVCQSKGKLWELSMNHHFHRVF